MNVNKCEDNFFSFPTGFFSKEYLQDFKKGMLEEESEGKRNFSFAPGINFSSRCLHLFSFAYSPRLSISSLL